MKKELAQKIYNELEEAANCFGEFQKLAGFTCPTGCGGCCMNSEISCHPYELLPMAIHLLEINQAEFYLEKARLHHDDHCLFLKIFDEKTEKGICSQYPFRPFVCRAFGVAGRKNKIGATEYSVCQKFKELPEYLDFVQKQFPNSPHIEEWRLRLVSLSPELLGREMPINQALIVILEKVLIWQSYNGSI